MKFLTLKVCLAAIVLLPTVAMAQSSSKSVKIVLPDAIDNLDPCRSGRNDVGRILKQNITETLTEIDPQSGKIIPRLATKWEQVSPTTWRFELRDGVKFHDGSDFNAAAVTHTIQRTLNPKLDCLNKQKFFANMEVTTKEIDPHTIEITTKPEQPILPTLMTIMTIVSPNTKMDEAERHPIGTGPFKLKSWTPGQQVLVERFDGYWGDKPEVEQATYVYRGESAVAAAMVKTGEADLAPYIAVQDADNPATDLDYLNTETAQLVMTMNSPPFNDVRVRKAVKLAIDRQAFVGTILSDKVQLASQVVVPTINGYNPDLKPWPYDLEQAKKLLAEAKADGVPVDKEMNLYGRPGFFPNLNDVLGALAQMLQELGLNVKVQLMEKAQFISMIQQPHEADRPAALFINLHDNSNGDASFTVFFKYHSKGGQSETADPNLDKVIEAAGKAVGDERRKLFGQAFRIVEEELVSDAPLFHLVGFARVSPRVDYKPTFKTNNELQLADIRFKKS